VASVTKADGNDDGRGRRGRRPTLYAHRKPLLSGGGQRAGRRMARAMFNERSLSTPMKRLLIAGLIALGTLAAAPAMPQAVHHPVHHVVHHPVHVVHRRPVHRRVVHRRPPPRHRVAHHPVHH
jgi:hypothetical protein